MRYGRYKYGFREPLHRVLCKIVIVVKQKISLVGNYVYSCVPTFV